MNIAQDFFSLINTHYLALLGRHVCCGFLQSIPLSIYAICAAEIDTAPADADGQMNFTRSSRLA
jgi:hypothetical protein